MSMEVSRLFAEERQQKVVMLLEKNGSVRVTELSEYFNVSEATIRRDLQEMEEKRLLRRTHGGAVKCDITNFEPSFLDKKNEQSEEKAAIGKLAAAMIKDGDTIILDSGTTTLEISKNIIAKNITVITNSVDIAIELMKREDVQIIVTGGILRNSTRAMVGHICENAYENFRVDKAFIGANGISVKEGITTPNFTEAQAKKAMIDCANKIIITADSSKFEKVCFSLIYPVEKITTIVTSGYIDKETIDNFKSIGIDIRIA